MMILCKANNNQVRIPASQQVNRIGKYLYKHLEGAFKSVKSGNMYDIYTTLLYQLLPEYGGKINDVQEMTVNINITTYQNKIRVDTIEMTPKERTLGFDLFQPEVMQDLPTASEKIMKKVVGRLRKAYQEYDILY